MVYDFDYFMDIYFDRTYVYWRLFYVSQIFKAFTKRRRKSVLDWQAYYIDQALPLWKEEQRTLLNELVEPVPELFRDVAKEKIAGKISEIALKEKATTLTLDTIIRGYITATPKKDHKFLIKKLKQKQIDLTPYEHLLDRTTKARGEKG